MPDLYRTKLCKMLISTGTCEDASCRFAHSKEEIRTTTIQRKAQASGSRGHQRGGAGARQDRSTGPQEAQSRCERRFQMEATQDVPSSRVSRSGSDRSVQSQQEDVQQQHDDNQGQRTQAAGPRGAAAHPGSAPGTGGAPADGGRQVWLGLSGCAPMVAMVPVSYQGLPLRAVPISPQDQPQGDPPAAGAWTESNQAGWEGLPRPGWDAAAHVGPFAGAGFDPEAEFSTACNVGAATGSQHRPVRSDVFGGHVVANQPSCQRAETRSFDGCQSPEAISVNVKNTFLDFGPKGNNVEADNMSHQAGILFIPGS